MKKYIVIPTGIHGISMERVGEMSCNLMNEEMAYEEADRLAKAYPQVKFIIFLAITSYRAHVVEYPII